MNKRNLIKEKKPLTTEEKRIRHNINTRKYYARKRAGYKKEAKTPDQRKNNHRISQRKHSYARLYGITLINYEKLLLFQNNSCAICGVNKSTLTRPLGVDHNHETGCVRGLLCSKCNLLLSNAKEDISVLNKAIEYLIKYSDNKLF